jgi:tetratricopeptide (TPR) repeat protein
MATVLTGALLAGCGNGPEPAAGFSDGSRGAASILTAAVNGSEGTESLAASYLAGRVALDDGDLRTAAENFGNALTFDPDNAELRRQVFTLRLGIGDYARAMALAEDLIVHDPAFGEARLLLAARAVLADDFAEAERQLGGIGERELASIALPVLDAWVTFGSGERAAAIATLLDAAEEESGLERIQRYHAASMKALDGQPATALADLQALVAPDEPNPVRVVLALAAVEVLAGDPAAAADLLERQLAIEPDDVVLETARAELAGSRGPALPIQGPATGMADALLSLAGAFDEQGAQAQALVLARLAGFLAPGQGDIALLIAGINLRQDNAAEALLVLEDVEADSVYAWEARLVAAQALAAMDREAEAVAELEAMAAERPERIDALVAQGDTLRRQERYAEAERAYDRALQRVDEITIGHWPLLYARGITRERTDRWPEAEADLQAALELEPDQPLVLNYLGYSWVDQGMNLTEAEAMLRRAVELRPDDGYIVDSMGWAYYRLGRYADAVRYLERAVELRPDDPVINDHLGDAYWQVGRYREARFQWERALTFEPEADQVALIERKLEHGLEPDEPSRG